MNQRFQNYTIIKDDSLSVLKYSRSAKYWTSLLLRATFAIASLLFLCAVVYTFFKSFSKWYHVIIPLLVLGVNIFIWTKFIYYLFQPTGKIVIINKLENKISIRKWFGGYQTLKISDVRQIEYTIIEDYVKFDSISKLRNYVDVFIKTNNGSRVDLFSINSLKIFEFDYLDEKKILIDRSKKLVKAIAKEAGVLSRFNGEVKDD